MEINNLNKEYTLENFILGDYNNLVSNVAKSVIENTEKCYNPLLIYGKEGLGKTHLMQAIGNKILENNPKFNVLYVTSEQFINELVEDIKNGKQDLFRNKYRNVDALLIDDIQYIAGKDRVQNELFYTFNDLKENGKQIIISSDRPPKDIEFLEDRLKSRFENGIFVELLMPDYDTKIKIMKKYSERIEFDVDDKTLAEILKNDNLNIRELEGILNQLKLICGAKITEELEKIIDFYKK